MAMLDNHSEASVKVPGLPDKKRTNIPDSVFRAYDIRGIAYEQLDVDAVFTISQAIGSEALSQGISDLYVGYDGRLSSPTLSAALIEGLRQSGCNVISLGLIPTPLLYLATHVTAIESGVMLTASHNPAHYNGLKIVFNKTSLADNQIQKIRERVAGSEFAHGQGGLSELDIAETYIGTVSERISLAKPLRVVIDCGNAVPGVIAPALFRALGCEVETLHCDLDGSFPNHQPDPTVAENLQELGERVRASSADLGIAFDGDGDRLGIVTETGDFIDADKLIMLLASDIAPDYANEAIVFDVKCSKRLAEYVEELGMKPVMHRSGHSFMKQKMEESGAPLGGEYAAHIFFKDRWFGFDDGMYAAARVVEILARSNKAASELFADFNMPACRTAEIRVDVEESRKFSLMQDLIRLAEFPDGQCSFLDGLRVEFDQAWGLVRASNTSPAILLRFEADTESAMAEIKNRFKALIHSADKNLELEF